MKKRSFALRPFASAGLPPDLKITGNIGRDLNAFSISYELAGPLAGLLVPMPSEMPERRNALWEETCFEFFLGPENSGQYWEFNLSPAGHWNVYRFRAYRQDMQEETAFASLPFSIVRSSDALNLSLELNLEKIIPANQELNIAISAVIKLMDGNVTYWALAHSGPQPDFHQRKSFVVEL